MDQCAERAKNEMDEVEAATANPLARYETNTPYGLFTLEVHILNQVYILVQLRSPFIEEWAGVEPDGGESGGSDEFWQESHPYNWEDPMDFPQTEAEFVDYLAYCAEEISREFDYRVQQAVEALSVYAKKYHERHGTSPPDEWLMEHQNWRGHATKLFRKRVVKIVLESMQGQSQQLTLFE